MGLRFDPASFIEQKVEEIRRIVGDEKVLMAVSGGVDSTTCLFLLHRAIGRNAIGVLIDTGFMRIGEIERVRERLTKALPDLNLKVVDAKEKFFNSVKGLKDAEEKRIAFRETFYNTLSELASQLGCKFLAQGTIAPDWIETTGGIKTQHNVLAQIGIRTEEKWGFTVIEPLADLYKDEVRVVARHLSVPPEVVERQPFPGPGLLVRCVGEVTEEKLKLTKLANKAVEEFFAPKEPKPAQYFAGVMDWDVERDDESVKWLEVPCEGYKLKVKVTGVKGDLRSYSYALIVKLARKPSFGELMEMQRTLISRNPEYTRVLLLLREGSGKYLVSARAVDTEDFMTADVHELTWEEMGELADRLARLEGVRAVCYDITPKPPATIEYE